MQSSFPRPEGGGHFPRIPLWLLLCKCKCIERLQISLCSWRSIERLQGMILPYCINGSTATTSVLLSAPEHHAGSLCAEAKSLKPPFCFQTLKEWPEALGHLCQFIALRCKGVLFFSLLTLGADLPSCGNVNHLFNLGIGLSLFNYAEVLISSFLDCGMRTNDQI